MRKRSAILLSAALLFTIGIIAWQATRPREPLYEGKPVSYWLRHPIMRQRTVTDVPGHATMTFISPDFPPMDTNALPAIILALRATDGPFHNAYQYAWTKLPGLFHHLLPHPVSAASIRYNATYLLTRMRQEYPEILESSHNSLYSTATRSAASNNLLLFPSPQTIHQNHALPGTSDNFPISSHLNDTNHFQDSTDLWSAPTQPTTHSYGIPVPPAPTTN